MSFLPQSGVRFVALGLGDFQRNVAGAQNALNGFELQAQRLSATTASVGTRIATFGDNMAAAGTKLTMGLTLPLIAAGAAFLKSGIDFEEAFAGVGKTVAGVSKGFAEIAEEMYGTAVGLTEVQKAAVFADDSFGDLTDLGEDLRQSFRDMAKEIPISANELSRIGQIAGQLGVPLGTSGEILLEFTKNMALLGVTTDLTSEEAATAIARIANIMGVTSDEFGMFSSQVANSIVALGNNFATTEPEIVALTYRIAGAGRALGLTTQEILAMSTALSSAGIRAELGGSAVSRILLEMSSAANDFTQSSDVFSDQVGEVDQSIGYLRTAIERGAGIDRLQQDFDSLNLEGLTSDIKSVEAGTTSLDDVLTNVRTRTLGDLEGGLAKSQEKFKLFAQAAGTSEAALASLIKTDPTQAFKLIVSGLSRMQEEGTLTTSTMNDLGLNSVRLRDVINRLGPNMGMLNDAIGISNGAWEDQIALQEEAQKRFKTIRSQITLLINRVKDFGITITDILGDDIQSFIGFLNRILDVFDSMDRSVQKQILRFAGLLAAIGPLTFAFGTFFGVFGRGLQTWERLFSSINIFGGIGKAGGLLGGLFGGITGIFKNTAGLAGTLSKGMLDIFDRVIFDVIGPVANLFGSFGKFAITSVFSGMGRAISGAGSLFLSLTQGLITTVTGLLSPIFGILSRLVLGPITSVLRGVSGIVGRAVGAIGQSVVGVFKLAGSVVGAFGKTVLGVAGKLPGFAASLFSNVLGPLANLPKLLALVGVGFVALFAPKIITNAVKNFSAVMDAFKSGIKKFVDDIKSFGLEKAILLLFGGGSTGSGEGGLILQLGRALGATEAAARKFSYAMGTAAGWAIYIVKATSSFVKTLFVGKQATDNISQAATTTSDRLVTLAETVAKLFEGFFVGWVSSFGAIRTAFDTFRSSISGAMVALGGLFDSIFGSAQQGTSELINTLEPGVRTGAMSIGETIGTIIGNIVTLGLQGLALILNIVAAVADGLRRLVDAYKTEGVEGVFVELGLILGGLWEGAITAAGLLWQSLKPVLEQFVTNAVDWVVNNAAPKIAKAFSFIFGGGEITTTETAGFFAFRDTGGGSQEYLGKLSAEAKRVAEETNTLFGQSLSGISFVPQIDADGNEMTQQVTRQFDGLVSIFSTAISEAAAWIQNEAWPTHIKPALESFLSSAQSYLSENVIVWASWVKTNVIDPIFAEIRTQIEEEVSSLPETIFDNLGVLSPTQSTEVSVGEDFLQPVNSDQVTAILSSFEQFGLDMSNNLAQGLEDGLLNEEARAELNAKLYAASIQSSMRDELEANSPSQVTYRIGVDVANGLINGLVDNKYRVTAASDATADAVLSMGARLIAGMPGLIFAANSVSAVFNVMQMNLSNSVNMMIADIMRLITATTIGMQALSNLNTGIQQTAPVTATNNNTTNNNNYAPTINTNEERAAGLAALLVRLYNNNVVSG